MISTIIVTGANGFLGQNILQRATRSLPGVRLVPIVSVRGGGRDLTDRDAGGWLTENVRLTDPGTTLLIHAAALVEWHKQEGLLGNAAMAFNVASWAQANQLGFCVLVSTVNVYAPASSTKIDTPCAPENLYGLGKWVAEEVWRLLLPPEHRAVVRLAGIWGWQAKPTLFWNRLLLAAARGFPAEPRPVVRRRNSRRNYISAPEVSDCLLKVGVNRMAGLFLAAGRDTVDMQEFVTAVQGLPDSKLSVDWQDDGGADECIYCPSAELLPWLRSFPEILSTIWANKPGWILGYP